MHDAVIRLGHRASVDPHFLAFALHEFAAAEGFDEPALAALLGTTPDGLAHLRLCPTPRADPVLFAEEVERMAARFGVSRDALAKVARFGHVVARLRPDPNASESATPFLAARDQPP